MYILRSSYLSIPINIHSHGLQSLIPYRLYDCCGYEDDEDADRLSIQCCLSQLLSHVFSNTWWYSRRTCTCSNGAASILSPSSESSSVLPTSYHSITTQDVQPVYATCTWQHCTCKGLWQCDTSTADIKWNSSSHGSLPAAYSTGNYQKSYGHYWWNVYSTWCCATAAQASAGSGTIIAHP